MKDTFSVAVIATMSSGKSTTINAMLGASLLPSKNEACTATVCKIEDIDGMQDFKARITTVNSEISNWENIGCEDPKLDEWNNSGVETIEIQGDFPHIDNYKKKIRFYDTPGPNNSTNKTHSEITNKILENSDYSFVVCVMNASQFGVDGEKKLLEDIKRNINKKKLDSKVVFAVNKINDLDLERESIENLMNNIHDYLVQDIGYKSPTIIPVNSLLSLNIRKIINAHKKGRSLDSEFSQRKQRQLYREIKYLKHFKETYFKAIFSTKEADKQSFLDRAIDQDRKVNTNDEVFIGGNRILIKDLIEVDIITGIPFLEEMLEIELIKSQESKKKKKLALRGK